MLSKSAINTTLAILNVVAVSIWIYVAAIYSYYSLGVFLTPFGLVLSGAIGGLTWLARRRWRTHAWTVFHTINAILFVSLITAQLIDVYKPTVEVQIPASYEGVVHIFIGEGDSKDIPIDENGIGYYQYHGQVNWRVLHGDVDITDALNESGSAQLLLFNSDSTSYTSIQTTCFVVETGKQYPSSPWNQRHEKCMEEDEYLRLVYEGVVDESMIESVTWLVEE